jgi:chemotaxis protein methyltransferase CheR
MRDPLILRKAEFMKISSYIEEHFGIVLKTNKMELVKSRLARRVEQLNFNSYREYFEHATSKEGEQELVEMVNALSTNLTYFYREEKHFEYLRQQVIPDILKHQRGENFKLRIWCTAASTGEEPYTITMEVLEAIGETPGCDFKLLATDVSTKVLQQAKCGVYAQERLEKIEPLFLSKYFQKGTGNAKGRYKIKNRVREHILFNYLNLIKPFPIHHSLDVIFCRNVMIYFDITTQQDIIDRFVRVLKPGGYLFMGMSEGLSGIQHPLTYVEPSIYRKKS